MSRVLIVVGAIALVVIAAGFVLLDAENTVGTESRVTTTAAAPPPAPEVNSADLNELEPAAGPADTASAGDPPATSPDPKDMPPAAAGDPPGASINPLTAKVISYFQKSKTKLDASRAFGFVLIPRAAVTDEEKRTQTSFCYLMLASLDFMTPGAVAAAAPSTVLPTYWPVSAERTEVEIAGAFGRRDCDSLIAWYDHALARKLAAKAGVADLSGPLLITWPSGDDASAVRDPLIEDFSKADHERARKAMQYWFRQLKNRPELWTNRIREGTIRAELADAVNDTAGVVLAVMSGKWESLKTVANP